MNSHALTYSDFEGIMVQLAQHEAWEFEFEGQPVSASSVFNEATFGPALLQAAQLELAVRGIAQDLALVLEPDDKAMFGKRVRFDDSRNGIVPGMWRLAQCAYQLQELPRRGHRICLDLVPAALHAEATPSFQAQG